MRGDRLGFVILAFAVLCVQGCTAASAFGRKCPGQSRADQRAVHAIWRAQRNAARSMPNGAAETERFSRALDFMERLTGVQSDTGTYLGRLPTPGLEDALKSWDVWYREHRCELELDLESNLLSVFERDAM